MDVDGRVVRIVHNTFEKEPVNARRMVLSLLLYTFSSALSSKGNLLQKK